MDQKIVEGKSRRVSEIYHQTLVCVCCSCPGWFALISTFFPYFYSSQLYMQEDSECSELCSCSDGGESTALSCYAICVSPAPCRTSLAYYSHASPAYQAFRGRCLCYSGKFICVRPPPGEYTLPGKSVIPIICRAAVAVMPL